LFLLCSQQGRLGFQLQALLVPDQAMQALLSALQGHSRSLYLTPLLQDHLALQIQSQLQAVNEAMVMMQKGLARWRPGAQEPALVCLLCVTLQLLQLLLGRLPGLLCKLQLSEPLVS
jgi:hypothetical protein